MTLVSAWICIAHNPSEPLKIITDEAVRVAVALRLGCSVCVANTCRCGALVDAQGIHGSVCKQGPSKIARHQAINDVIAVL